MSVRRNVLVGLLTAGAVTLAVVGGGPLPDENQSSGEAGGFEYEGRLLENGLPVNAVVDLEFGVFDRADGGVQVGPTLFAQGVPVEDGYFLVTLEFGAFEFNASRHWLQMNVDGLTMPRQRLVRTFDLGSITGAETAGETDEAAAADEQTHAQVGATSGSGAMSGRVGNGWSFDPGNPVGLRALAGAKDERDGDPDGDPDDNPFSADTNDGPGGFEDATGVWETRGSEYYYKRANVGIGTSNPAYPLDVRHSSRSRTLNVDNTDGSGTRYGIYARAKSTTGRAVYGYASASSGGTFGVWGRSNSTSGTGLYGQATATTGTTFGVRGQSTSATGTGAYGYATDTVGVNYGVWGQSDSPGGYGGMFTGNFRQDMFTSGGGDADLFQVYGTNGMLFFQLEGDATRNLELYDDAGTSIFGLSSSTQVLEISDSADNTIFNIDAGNAELEINAPGGGRRILLDPVESNSSGADLLMYNDNGDLAVEIDSEGGGGPFFRLIDDNAFNEFLFFNNKLTIYDTFGFPTYSIDGNAAKNAIIHTPDYGARLVYTQESTEVWFEDFGSAQLIGGEARIDLDPMFLQTVTIDDQHPMQVFITLYGDSNGVYVERDLDHFIVRELKGGTGFAEFGYRVVGHRKGFEDDRMEPYIEPSIEGGTDNRDPIEAADR